MADNLDRILDECIDRINRGEGVDGCLADYPDYSERLRPLLQAMLHTKEAYSAVPSASAKRAARQHFNTALERAVQKRQQPWFPKLSPWPVAWATLAAVLLIIVIGYFGLRPVISPPGPAPSPEGNFVFLISDDVNAIEDFESVTVSVSKIGLLRGDSDEWVEFEPEIEEVDLALVKGDKTQEIWRGNVPESQYTQVFIHVADVYGVLKETAETVEIKLPSRKLHISKSFQVTAATVTSFTYDLTVISTGSPQSGIRYILKPQVDESGASSKANDGKDKGKRP